MIATNHALTGAAIGLSVQQPWLALPLALLSHFLLDSLPHFGFTDLSMRGRKFALMLMADALGCYSLVVLLYVFVPYNWVVPSLAAFLAASPDFMWAPAYFRYLRTGKEKRGDNWVMRLHSRVQWYQRPPGALIELLYMTTLVIILVKLVII